MIKTRKTRKQKLWFKWVFATLISVDLIIEAMILMAIIVWLFRYLCGL